MLYLFAGNYFEARNYAEDELLSADEWSYVAKNESDCPAPRPMNVVAPVDVIAAYSAEDQVLCVGTYESGGKYTYQALGQLQDAGVQITPHHQLQDRIELWEWA